MAADNTTTTTLLLLANPRALNTHATKQGDKQNHLCNNGKQSKGMAKSLRIGLQQQQQQQSSELCVSSGLALGLGLGPNIRVRV
jgi:CTP:molybdopterin cytidylyltransferase MocA